MILKFDSLYDISKLKDCNVLLILGQYNIFNNIAERGARSLLGGGGLDYLISGIDTSVSENGRDNEGYIDEFETVDNSDGSLSIREFFAICRTPAMYRRWYCHVRYEFIGKRDKSSLMEYLKHTSNSSLLIVTVSEYRDINELKRNQVIKSAKGVYAIELNYPYRDVLEDIIHNMFLEHGYNVTHDACKLFSMKMGVEYDEYADCVQQTSQKFIENGIVANNNKCISYADMKSATSGINNFVLDDLVKALLKTSRTANVVKTRKVYKVLNILLSDMSAYDICSRLKKRIYVMMQYRMHINNGCIPVRTRYNCDIVKKRIGDSYKIKNASPISFKRNAYIASLTSMEDWMYMYSILSSVTVGSSEDVCIKALLNIANRRMFSVDRLMNSMKVMDTLHEELVDLNSLFYSKWWNELKRIE